MAKIHIGNLIEINHWVVDDNDEFDQGSWQAQYRFQNANTRSSVIYEGQEFKFLSFIYQGATRSRTGDNIEAGLALSTNQVSMDYGYEMVVLDYNAQQHHIKRQIVVTTCLMNDEFSGVDKVLNREYWIGASMSYDETSVEILLSSAIDAVYSGMPNVYLTEKTVGRLPTTARVATS